MTNPTIPASGAQPPAAQPAWKKSDLAKLAKTYDALHKGKLGAHWLWCVVEQVAAGVSEVDALREYGYVARPPAALSDEQILAVRTARSELLEAAGLFDYGERKNSFINAANGLQAAFFGIDGGKA